MSGYTTMIHIYLNDMFCQYIVFHRTTIVVLQCSDVAVILSVSRGDSADACSVNNEGDSSTKHHHVIAKK